MNISKRPERGSVFLNLISICIATELGAVARAMPNPTMRRAEGPTVSHICEQVAEAAQYLESVGMTGKELSALHHLNKSLTFRGVIDYFNVNRDIRRQTSDFANRVLFVAREHRIRSRPLDSLIQLALNRWPLTR